MWRFGCTANVSRQHSVPSLFQFALFLSWCWRRQPNRHLLINASISYDPIAGQHFCPNLFLHSLLHEYIVNKKLETKKRTAFSTSSGRAISSLFFFSFSSGRLSSEFQFTFQSISGCFPILLHLHFYHHHHHVFFLLNDCQFFTRIAKYSDWNVIVLLVSLNVWNDEVSSAKPITCVISFHFSYLNYFTHCSRFVSAAL